MRLQVRPATAKIILICAIALYALAYLNHTTPALRDWLKAETHGYSYVLGAATPVLGAYLLLPIIALLFVGMMNVNKPGWAASRFQWPIRTGAELTLSIYLFHEPVFFLMRGLRLQPNATIDAAALAILSFVVVVALGALLEPRRKAWRRGLAFLFGAFGKARLQHGVRQ
jgi:peptidoglycan/LPS O-acetylase OafA/YrhL